MILWPRLVAKVKDVSEKNQKDEVPGWLTEVFLTRLRPIDVLEPNPVPRIFWALM